MNTVAVRLHERWRAVHGHGATYTGPASALAAASKKQKAKKRPRGVTLYLHGLGLGEWLWNFQPVAGYNFVRGRRAPATCRSRWTGSATARATTPTAMASCIGSQADVAHQIVQALQAGHLHGQRRQGARSTSGWRSSATPPPARSRSRRGVLLPATCKALVVVGFSFSNLPRGQRRVRVRADRLRDGRRSAATAAAPTTRSSAARRPSFRSDDVPQRPEGGQAAAVPLHYPDPCGDNLLADRHDPAAGGRGREDQGPGAGGLRQPATSCTRRSAARRRRERFTKSAAQARS